MVRRLKELAQTGGEGQLATAIRDSANQIWLAGLGAFAKTQKEGTKIFDLLVEEGQTIHKQAKKTAEDAFSGIKAKAAKSWGQVSWDQMERVFEDRVARALHALSVPTRKDLDTLSQRVAELTAVTKKLSEALGTPTGTRPRRTRRPAASKRA